MLIALVALFSDSYILSISTNSCILSISTVFSIFPSAIIGRYYEESLQYDLYYLVCTHNTLTTTKVRAKVRAKVRENEVCKNP